MSFRGFVSEAAEYFALAFVFWPWAVGVVDIAAWMTVGQQLTSIPWPEARGLAMVMWPIACITLLVFWKSLS